MNSVDVVFNFDCVGFTGTPFIDNYPTSSYIRKESLLLYRILIDRGSTRIASRSSRNRILRLDSECSKGPTTM